VTHDVRASAGVFQLECCTQHGHTALVVFHRALSRFEDYYMVSIVDLLNRIRWDKEFGKGEFVIGYENHMLDHYVYVPFEEIQLKNEMGELITIPFHRVREVLKDNKIIWQRPKHTP
jgi:uncharacterized protein (UPF0248 family)